MSVREKGRRRPGSQPLRPFSRPQPPRNAAKVRGFSHTASAFTAETDCLLEERGFEPLVPRTDGVAFPNTFLPPRAAPSEGRSVPARGERPTGRIPLSSTAALLRTW
jgi:hypothetical protein